MSTPRPKYPFQFFLIAHQKQHPIMVQTGSDLSGQAHTECGEFYGLDPAS
jgi:hypothetical protein